jgi:hypothetical protein
MTGRQQDALGTRRGRRAAAAGAAVAMVALGLVSSALAAPRAMPAVSPAATGISRAGQAAGRSTDGSGAPAGWVPVPFRRAQLSVPGLCWSRARGSPGAHRSPAA